MNDSIVCEKCNYDLFMICPDGLTVCNHCGEFSSFPTHPPTVPPAIVEPAQAVEPLDAPHPDYAEYITFEGSTRIVISPDDYEQLYNAATRRAPPAIDAETKRMVLEQTNTKAAEPAQSVPAFWASENILKEYLRDNISCVLTTTKCAANTMPLYTVPPAIDETRHKLILVCEYLETVGLMFVSPRVISSQIRAILEAGNGE